MVTHDVDERCCCSDGVVMMTNGPAATIGGILAIDLRGPRDRIAARRPAAVHGAARGAADFLYRKQMKERREENEAGHVGNAWPCAHAGGMLKIAPDVYDITVFGAEPTPTKRICSRPCSPGR